MSGLADARRAYLDQPSRFGRDDHAVRVAEADAFTAGWEAAQAAARLEQSAGERFSLVPSTFTVLDLHRPALRARFYDIDSAFTACRRLNANEKTLDLYLWTDR